MRNSPIGNVTYYKERHGKVKGYPCVALLLGFAPLTPFRYVSRTRRKEGAEPARQDLLWITEVIGCLTAGNDMKKVKGLTHC